MVCVGRDKFPPMNFRKLSGNTVGEVIEQVAERFRDGELFFGHGTDNADDEAAWLVFCVAGLSYSDGAQVYTQALFDSALAKIETLSRERVATRKPLAYLLHEAWFMGLRFYVDERVLVPRSPIAELIAEQFEPWLQKAGGDRRFLDMGTGSGCIAIALAHAFPDATVDAVDISSAALEVASRNVQEHAMTARVQLIQSDLFAALGGSTYDLIVANPPYVDARDMRDRPAEFRHEPELGLASGFDGLDATRVILKEASRFLNETGILVCEVGNSRDALDDAFPGIPFVWLEFEHGGDGVFLLSKQDLESA